MAESERAYERWFDPALVVSPEEVAAYDALSVAADRAEDVAYFLRFLVTGRDSENVDLNTAMALRLRKSYLKLVNAYQLHDAKYDRGWDVPDWRRLDDVPTIEGNGRKGLRTWTLDRWFETELPQIQARSELHAAVLDRKWQDRSKRAERKMLNAVMALLGKELDYVRWVLDIA